MELIGQFDSPFTRRVGITMRIYGIPFTHNRWSVFGNADELSKVNPLIRVPTLVLDSGEALIETSAIIDYLDSLVPPDRQLTPQAQPARYRDQQIVSMASGVSDMAVRLFYEKVLHKEPSVDFVARITKQMSGALAWLETAIAARRSELMTQADIAVTCSLRHLREAHPDMMPKSRYPALEKHCTHFEAQPVFIDISQAFIPPA
jgi:glutathione S-transferase